MQNHTEMCSHLKPTDWTGKFKAYSLLRHLWPHLSTPRLLRTTWMIRDQNRSKISEFAFRIVQQSLLLHEDRQMQTSLTHGLQNGHWLQSNSVQQPALHCKHHLFIWALLSLNKKNKKKKKKTHAFLPLVLESVDWTYTQNGKKNKKKC